MCSRNKPMGVGKSFATSPTKRSSISEGYGSIKYSLILSSRNKKVARCIVGPREQLLGGPMDPGDGIFYADINADNVIIPKFIHDFSRVTTIDRSSWFVFLSQRRAKQPCLQQAASLW
jgi:hypothetical protein